MEIKKVIIGKGEMPKSCCDCDFGRGYEAYSMRLYCDVMHETMYLRQIEDFFDERHDKCPLVEVESEVE